MSAEIIRPRAFHRGPAVRCADPVDELYALAALAETRTEKLKIAVETSCDDQILKIEGLLDQVQRLLRPSTSHESGGVSQ